MKLFHQKQQKERNLREGVTVTQVKQMTDVSETRLPLDRLRMLHEWFANEIKE